MLYQDVSGLSTLTKLTSFTSAINQTGAVHRWLPDLLEVEMVSSGSSIARWEGLRRFRPVYDNFANILESVVIGGCLKQVESVVLELGHLKHSKVPVSFLYSFGQLLFPKMKTLSLTTEGCSPTEPAVLEAAAQLTELLRIHSLRGANALCELETSGAILERASMEILCSSFGSSLQTLFICAPTISDHVAYFPRLTALRQLSLVDIPADATDDVIWQNVSSLTRLNKLNLYQTNSGPSLAPDHRPWLWWRAHSLPGMEL